MVGSAARDCPRRTAHAASIRSTPVDQVDANAVRRLLEPIWNKTPETASRLRARIEAVLASAQVAGHIDADRPNPARWKGWLDHMLPNPRKLGERGHHAALPYGDVPALMTRLAEVDTTASRALRLTVLTAARSGEVLKMTWDEVSFETATWTVPKERMKMGHEHATPLSDAAIAILRDQHEARGKNPHVFPGRPQRPLSAMAMSMLLKRPPCTASDRRLDHGWPTTRCCSNRLRPASLTRSATRWCRRTSVARCWPAGVQS